MAGKTVQCSGCRRQLLAPPHAKSIRCAVCGTVSDIRPQDPIVQLQDQAKKWVKGFLTAIGSSSSYQPNGYAAPYHTQTVMWPPSYPPAHGRKRAVLVGISYTGRRYELKGTVNDVNCMRFLLKEKFGFPDQSILVLTEVERDPYRIPTKHNMRASMHWLVHGCRPGDSLVFHFSGHGSQQRDVNGDEVDGYDETLCPLDYETNGMIVDDEINSTIVRPLPQGAKLHAIIDACHSGTILDLPYLCRMNRAGYYQWEDHSPPSGVYKGTRGGLAISFSGCDDNQTSSDTTAFSGYTTTGAMTYCFIQAVEREPGATYGRLLHAMRSSILEANRGSSVNGPIASLLRKVFQVGFTQEPQLSSTEIYDVYRKAFTL